MGEAPGGDNRWRESRSNRGGKSTGGEKRFLSRPKVGEIGLRLDVCRSRRIISRARFALTTSFINNTAKIILSKVGKLLTQVMAI